MCCVFFRVLLGAIRYCLRDPGDFTTGRGPLAGGLVRSVLAVRCMDKLFACWGVDLWRIIDNRFLCCVYAAPDRRTLAVWRSRARAPRCHLKWLQERCDFNSHHLKTEPGGRGRLRHDMALNHVKSASGEDIKSLTNHWRAVNQYSRLYFVWKILVKPDRSLDMW